MIERLVFALALVYLLNLVRYLPIWDGSDSLDSLELEDFNNAAINMLEDAEMLKERVFESVEGKVESAIRGLFDSLDKDKDGQISLEEFEGMTLSTWAAWHAFGEYAANAVTGFPSTKLITGFHTMKLGIVESKYFPQGVGWRSYLLIYIELLLMTHVFLFMVENLRYMLGLPRSGWNWPQKPTPLDKIPRVSKAIATEYTTPLKGYELYKTIIFTVTGFALFRFVMFAFAITIGVCLMNVAAIFPSKRWRNFWLFGPVRMVVFAGLSFLGYHRVVIEGKFCDPKKCKLLIPNHIGAVEILVVSALSFPSFVSAIENTRLPLFSGICRVLDALLVDRWDPKSKSKTLQDIKARATDKSDDAPQLMIFPEGTCDNQAALFRFNGGAFAAGEPVQLIAFKMPYSNFNPCYTGREVGGCELLDLIWRSCCQFVQRMEVKILPVHYPTKKEKENSLIYANNMQLRMASYLGTGVSDATYKVWKLITAEYKIQLKKAQLERRRQMRGDGDRKSNEIWNPLTACGVCSDGIVLKDISFDLKKLEKIFQADASKTIPEYKDLPQISSPRLTPSRRRGSSTGTPTGLLPNFMPVGLVDSYGGNSPCPPSDTKKRR